MAGQGQINKVQWSPRDGGLNSDIDPKNIQSGDLYVSGINTGGMNISAVGKGAHVSPSYEPVTGNEWVYSISPAFAQNKKWRIYVDVSSHTLGTTYTFDYSLNTPSGLILTSGLSSTVTIDPSISTTLANFESFFNTAFTSYTPYVSSVITDSYTGYVEIELAYADCFDYKFTITEISSDGAIVSLIVSQEAIDPGCVAEWNLIGSDDRPIHCFQFWTTRRGLPEQINIVSVTEPSTGVTMVTTDVDHGLVENQAVYISGVVGLPFVIGEWTVINVTATTFELANCTWGGGSYVSGGIVEKNIKGLGEIGVAVKNDDNTITYTRLLRSVEFNFSTLHQIDVRVKRKQDSRYAAYFTDNYNSPRVFYYKGLFATDNALEYINPENIYNYGSISSELNWILTNAGFRVDWSSQIQTGGNVKSGNWRYSIRLLTADFTATQWSDLTNAVPVYNYNNTSGPYILGDDEVVPTPKINVVAAYIDNPELYQYIELAGVNYFGSLGFQAYIIGRYPLNPSDTIKYINHNGNEVDSLDLDPGELNVFATAFVKAQNVELLDNRAILSNLTPGANIDFTDWVQTFRYSIETDTVDAVGVYGSLSANEYQLPDNCYSKMSHMIYETYRYGFKFKLKNGTYTQVYYYDDIKIDIPASLSSYPLKRDPGSFTSFDLTNGSTPTSVNTFYIDFHNINLEYKINGVEARLLIDEIIPVRADVVPTVLWNGVGLLGSRRWTSILKFSPGPQPPPLPGDVDQSILCYGNGSVGSYSSWSLDNGYSDYNTDGQNTVGPYPFYSGSGLNFGYVWHAGGNCGGGDDDPLYPGIPGCPGADDYGGADAERRSLFLYSPDHYFTNENPYSSYQSGDQLIFFGAGNRYSVSQVASLSTNPWVGSYSEYNGTFGVNDNSQLTIINCDESFNAGNGQSDISLSTSGYKHSLRLIFGETQVQRGIIPAPFYQQKGQDFFNASPTVHRNQGCIITRLNSGYTYSGVNSDRGFYNCLYYRPLTIDAQYGQIQNTKYRTVGSPFVIGSLSGTLQLGNVKVYGNVFNQKTYLRQREVAYDGTYPSYGFGACVSFYSQNRGNTQLKRKQLTSTPSSSLAPETALSNFVNTNFSQSNGGYTLDPQLFYNNGYTPRNQIQLFSSYDQNLEYQTDWGNAIAWSNMESEGSNTDNLRVFPPLNLKFLDYTQGPIEDARALNRELITVQHREVQRQYFNSTAMQTTVNGGEVYLGTGAVLSRYGTTMNKFGSKHKWSIVTGLSSKGFDVMYGIDDINNTAWRIGYDGTNSLDEIHGMKSFFANNLQWIKGKYTPAHDEGIRGVANQRYRDVIWTFRGRKEVPQWIENETSSQVIGFQSTIGNELIVNPTFNGSTGNLPGWDNFLGPPNNVWSWGVPIDAPSGTQPGACRWSGNLGGGPLVQAASIFGPGDVGKTFRIIIDVPVCFRDPVNPLAQKPYIKFAALASSYFEFNSPGTYTLSYTVQAGDDNVYIYGPNSWTIVLNEISVREIFNYTTNWDIGSTWEITNNEACSNGGSDALIQNVPVYILANKPYTLTYEVTNMTTGSITPTIGNVAGTPVTSNGVYTETITPTATGVVLFTPSGGFDGCIKGNLLLTTTSPAGYSLGEAVQVTSSLTTWTETPDIYLCIAPDDTVVYTFPPDDPENWELIPHTDPRYYTEYTIVYNELKDKFQSFLSILPRIYAHFQNGYLVPKPKSNTGRMYISDRGTYTRWFDNQTSEAYLDAVINSPKNRKRFLAVRSYSDNAPTSMTVTSPTASATTSGGSFVQREGNEWDGYVSDEIGTDSIIQGEYGIFRFLFAAMTYNRFNGFIASIRERARKWFR